MMSFFSNLFGGGDQGKQEQKKPPPKKQRETMTLYRGMSYTHPKFAEAKRGRVSAMSSVNRGATFDTENTSWTAWDTDWMAPAGIAVQSHRVWAIEHRASSGGLGPYDPEEPVGVVLQVTVDKDEVKFLNGGEVQISGSRNADAYHFLYPDSDLVTFQTTLKDVRNPSASQGETYASTASLFLGKRTEKTVEELDRERKEELIHIRLSSIYEKQQKEEMRERLMLEYGLK